MKNICQNNRYRLLFVVVGVTALTQGGHVDLFVAVLVFADNVGIFEADDIFVAGGHILIVVVDD